MLMYYIYKARIDFAVNVLWLLSNKESFLEPHFDCAIGTFELTLLQSPLYIMDIFHAIKIQFVFNKCHHDIA